MGSGNRYCAVANLNVTMHVLRVHGMNGALFPRRCQLLRQCPCSAGPNWMLRPGVVRIINRRSRNDM
jgi:hypothetical protein